MIPTRILVADDDQSIRQFLGTIIRREGFEVDTAADGVEAIGRLAARDYAVILLDLMMPRKDGFEVIEYLKSHHQRTKPVVLVISAYADQRLLSLFFPANAWRSNTSINFDGGHSVPQLTPRSRLLMNGSLDSQRAEVPAADRRDAVLALHPAA